MKREELIPAIIEGLITNVKKMFLDVNIGCTYEEIAEIIADEILSLSLSPAAGGEESNIIKIPIRDNYDGRYRIEYDGKYITLFGKDKDYKDIFNGDSEEMVLVPVVIEKRNIEPVIGSVTESDIIIRLSPQPSPTAEKPITAEEVFYKWYARMSKAQEESDEPFNDVPYYLAAMEEYASSRTVKESLTVEPMTAEEFLAKRNYDPTLAYPHILVVQLMEEYASKPTVEERKVGDE